MVTISTLECAKMIRVALKQGFPGTTFSVRKTKSTYDYNIDVHWTDGPTTEQVKPILDRFKSKGFDGMTDCGYYCGSRKLNGVVIEVGGGYVTGSRSTSRRLRQIIVDKLATECGLTGVTLSEPYGNITGGETVVPYQWHPHYEDAPLTLESFQSKKHVLASDPHGPGEWFSNLVYRVERSISMEEQKPITMELPEYIDVQADVSTGRASFEEPRKMFEGHAALEQETADIASFESAPVPAVPADFHCSIGRAYAAGKGGKPFGN